jgi:GTP-binding protein EngB required for normal cell division
MFEQDVKNEAGIKSNLLLSLETLKKIIYSFQIESLKRELQVIERYSAENELVNKCIDIVVLGQFKAGKSSLINNIINESILPVGVIPVTSIVTRLQFAEEKKAIVHFLNKIEKVVNIAEIENFITESKNPRNIKNVEIVDLYLPQLYNFKKLRIVDTPGIGSFFKNNSDTTFQWLPEIGLALVAISVERPLSDEDVILLKSVVRYSADTKIILTKADLISDSQLNEIGHYVEDSLLQAGLNVLRYGDALPRPFNTGQKPIEIISHSILKNTEANHKSLIEKVFLAVKENFSENLDKILNHKINSLIQSCLSYLKIGLESNRKTKREREALKEQIIDEQLKYQLIKNNLDIITASFKNKNREKVADIVMSYSKDIRTRLEDNFEKEFHLWKGNLYTVSRKYEEWLHNNLKEILLIVGERAMLQLNDYMADIQNHFDLFAESFTDRLTKNVEKILGIRLNPVVLNTEVEGIKQPDISVSFSFDIHIDLLWFFFPMFLFRKIFKKFFFKKIPYEVDKNLSRLTSGVAFNISKVIDKNGQLVNQYIRDEILSIENIIENRKYETNNFNQAIGKIENISKQNNFT